MYIDGLDELDNKILTVIEKDARLSYSEIGSQVGLSRVAVKNRMDAMQEKGIIQGFYTKINAYSSKEGFHFFIDLYTVPASYTQVAEYFSQFSVIRKIYALDGDCRLRLEGFASNRSSYESFYRQVSQHLDGIKNCVVCTVQYLLKDADEKQE